MQGVFFVWVNGPDGVNSLKFLISEVQRRTHCNLVSSGHRSGICCLLVPFSRPVNTVRWRYCQQEGKKRQRHYIITIIIIDTFLMPNPSDRSMNISAVHVEWYDSTSKQVKRERDRQRLSLPQAHAIIPLHMTLHDRKPAFSGGKRRCPAVSDLPPASRSPHRSISSP